MTEQTRQWISAMRAGRYEEAWSLANQALEARHPATRDDPCLPYHQRWVWGGQRFDGEHVTVRCYHGLGDTIQFLRYLPLLAMRVASLTVEIQPSLLPVIATMAKVGKFVAFNPARPLPRSPCDIEIMELDFVLRQPPTKVEPPYLRMSPALLPRGTVGLCLSSGAWDKERDVPSEFLERLCAKTRCLSLAPGPIALNVLNPSGCPLDMAITASLVSAVDLVITVDTMIAHLAGALGKRTWLLLKSEPDWRWAPNSKTTDWYPSMTLYVQRTPGDWREVISRLERDWATSDLATKHSPK